MHHSKTYFILPTTVYRPDDLIQLGQVITDPRKPFERLAKPLPLEGFLQPRAAPAVEWSATNTKTGEASVGVFAHVVSIMKAEASGGKSQNETKSWEAALLETQYFEIAEDSTYVEQTAKVPVVQEWLKEYHHLGKSVYMVTGLKIAKNPGKVTYDGSDASNLDAKLKTTLDPKGVIDGGGHATHQRSGATTYEEKPEAAYVFAYRLRKLRVTWGHQFKLRDYKKGGDLHGVSQGGAGEDSGREDENNVSALQMESVLLEQNDFGASLPAKDKKFQAVDEEDNSACLVIRATV